MGNRLQRGRGYARKGQVLSLQVDAGSVTARVQGSRSRPYRVRIGLQAFGKAQWAGLERELAGNAWYLATLLAGEMPDDIEDVFAGVGLSLFPASAGELSLDCSCPDWEVPCKHLAATFYLLAESFDDDPFRILAWRGRPREDLLDNLNAARSDRSPAADSTEHRGVPLEDLGERFTDRGANACPYEALRGVFARRPAAEVRVDDEDRGAGEARIVERVARVGLAIVLEQVALEALERDGDEKSRRHDPIGVDVVASQRQASSVDLCYCACRAGAGG